MHPIFSKVLKYCILGKKCEVQFCEHIIYRGKSHSSFTKMYASISYKRIIHQVWMFFGVLMVALSGGFYNNEGSSYK